MLDFFGVMAALVVLVLCGLSFNLALILSDQSCEEKWVINEQGEQVLEGKYNCQNTTVDKCDIVELPVNIAVPRCKLIIHYINFLWPNLKEGPVYRLKEYGVHFTNMFRQTS